jgi:hypothetical protein
MNNLFIYIPNLNDLIESNLHKYNFKGNCPTSERVKYDDKELGLETLSMDFITTSRNNTNEYLQKVLFIQKFYKNYRGPNNRLNAKYARKENILQISNMNQCIKSSDYKFDITIRGSIINNSITYMPNLSDLLKSSVESPNRSTTDYSSRKYLDYETKPDSIISINIVGSPNKLKTQLDHINEFSTSTYTIKRKIENVFFF